MNKLKYKFNIAPICPYCDSQMDSDGLFSRRSGDGALREVICVKCKITYIVEQNLETSYSTYKREQFNGEI